MATAAEVWSDLDDETAARARRFHRFHRLSAVVAAPRAVLLYLRLCLRSPAGLRWLRRGGHGLWRTVFAIAASRLVRRAQRTTRYTPSPVVVWPEAMPSSCVIAYFHTTWDVVIARAVADREYCLIRSGPRRAQDLGRQHVAEDTAGLKSLVRRVAKGARCAAAADNFVPGPEGGFLGTRHALNPAVARLAAITGTPLVAVWPIYERGVLRFDLGKPIAASICAERPDEALRIARQFFENAVRRDLASWRRIVPFLERALRAG
jgi:hypothetical protein